MSRWVRILQERDSLTATAVEHIDRRSNTFAIECLRKGVTSRRQIKEAVMCGLLTENQSKSYPLISGADGVVIDMFACNASRM